MTSAIRAVTAGEIDFFAAHGWAYLPALVDPAWIDRLREIAVNRLRDVRRTPSAGVVDRAFGQDRDVAQFEPDFHRLTHHPAMGANAVHLLGTAERVRVQISNLLVKEPAGAGRHSEPTVYHQDFPWLPMDRSAMLTFWVALAPVTAEMGSLRFFDKSNALGLLGRSFVTDGDDIPTQHAWLTDQPVVGGYDLSPGDATVHHALTVHGAPKNSSSTARLSFTATYFDANALYTGAPYSQTDQLSQKLEVNRPFEHPAYPIVGSEETR